MMANNIALGKLITFFYGLIDVDERRITYTNAPTARRRSGTAMGASSGRTGSSICSCKLDSSPPGTPRKRS